MVIPNWQDLKNNRFWALWDAFVILVVIAIIIAALAVSVSLAPVITSALTFFLLSPVMVNLISLLPLMVSMAIAIQFLYAGWCLVNLTFDSIKEKEAENRAYVIEIFSLFSLLLFPFIKLLVVDFADGIIRHYEGSIDIQGTRFFEVFVFWMGLATLISLGLGLYLSVMILPSLISAIAALTGLPSIVTGLFAVLAVMVLIKLTQDLLMLPFRLITAFWNFIIWGENTCKDPVFYLLQGIFTLTGIVLIAYTSSIIFPMIVASLLPLLPHTTAVFTAVAICVSLVMLTMTTLPVVSKFLGGCIRMVADNDKNEPSELTLAFKDSEVSWRRWLLGPYAPINLQLELRQDYCSSESYTNKISPEKSAIISPNLNQKSSDPSSSYLSLKIGKP